MVQTIYEFLMANLASVIVVVVVSGVGIYFWLDGKKKEVALVCLELIGIAEGKMAHGENEAKLNLVIDGLYNRFPHIVKFFFTKDDLVKFINKMVKDTKAWLQNQSK